MTAQPLDLIPIPGLYVLSIFALLLAVECGFRLNRRIRRHSSNDNDAHVGVVAGASLAMLGFLLAFVVSLGTDVLKQRWQLIIDEVNAIGTAHLRAGLLEEPQRSASRQLLKDYVDIRLMAWDSAKLQQAFLLSNTTHEQLWALAEASATREPTPVTSLYIIALNDVIDRHTERVAYGLGIRIPPTIVLSLFLVAAMSAFLVGMLAKETRERNPIAILIMTVILSAVLMLIIDLDRPGQGLLKVPHQPMLDLKQKLAETE